VLAQVITPHTAVVTVINSTITSAILDDRWDMLTQTYLTESKLSIEEAMVIAQNSECVREGTLTGNYVHNSSSKSS